MADAFDPYRKWLGIPPQEQPPDHYRLLGLRCFEADPDVITHAADARMVHLKTLQAGEQAIFAQKLLNEVAAASVCLLNPEKKAAYDRQLRQRSSAASGRVQEPSSARPPLPPPPLQAPPPQPPPPQPPQPPPTPPKPPPPTVPEVTEVPRIDRLPVSAYGPRRQRSTWLIPVMIIGGLMLLSAVLAVVLGVF
jgi:hypothetical protein